MYIGFDGSRAFQDNKTGTENYSYNLLKALSEIDKRNTYVVYLRSIGIQVLAVKGWPKNFKFKIINWPRFWTQLGLAKQTLTDNLDVLFIPSHTLPLIRRPGLKTIVTVHDLGSEYLPTMHQLKQRLYLSLMQKYQLKTATKLIAVSNSTRDDLVKKVGIEVGKVEVVYEGYDRILFKPIIGDTLVSTLRHYGLQMQNYFLFVGTVQPRKNLERVIRAFGNFIKNHESRIMNQGRNKKDHNSKFIIHNSVRNLVIAGSKGWLSDEIYQLPKDLGIEKRVKFLGYVPDKNLPGLYSGARALIFPSLFEGFGLPIIEAQACNCPVITSNISSMPEIASKGALFVNPYSIDDIVKRMNEVQSSNLKVQRLINAGMENVKRFSWEKAARETISILEETAG
jgi:glycosyltransferase involved in cell wall biosynthesis